MVVEVLLPGAMLWFTLIVGRITIRHASEPSIIAAQRFEEVVVKLRELSSEELGPGLNTVGDASGKHVGSEHRRRVAENTYLKFGSAQSVAFLPLQLASINCIMPKAPPASPTADALQPPSNAMLISNVHHA